MNKNYPRYPVDIYLLRVIFGVPTPPTPALPQIIIDVVRENPFGTAFLK